MLRDITVTTGKAPYVTHRFGSTFGGPIRHDKDFFFGSYGGYRYATSTLYTSAVPDVAQMQGNFSENIANPSRRPRDNQHQCLLKAPTSLDNTAIQFWVCNRATGFPYANNTLTTLDPTIQNVLKYLANGNLTGPLANTGPLLQNPGAFGDTKYTHHEFDPAPQTNNEYLIKTDHQLTPSHRVNLSYFRYSSSVASLPGGLTSSWTYSNYASTQQNANVSDTWTISPRTVNQAWVSYTRQFGGRIPVPSTDTWATFGSDFGISGLPSRGQISDHQLVRPDPGHHRSQGRRQSYGLRDVLNTTRGKHTLYLGGEAGLEKDFQQTSLDNYGVFGFTTAAGARTNYSLSDFIAG